MLDESTLNDYVINNQSKLLEEINDIQLYLSLIEREIKSSNQAESLSDDQVQTIWRKLRTAGNFVYSANHYWARYTNNRKLIKILVDEDRKETAKIVGREIKEIDLGPTNQIFPSLPMTEESAKAVAEEIKEAARKKIIDVIRR